MTSSRWWRLAVLLAAGPGLGAAGCGQSDGSGNGGAAGAGGLIDGCVDIAITPSVLGDANTWLAVGPLTTTLWTSEDALHAAWVGYHVISAGKARAKWLAMGTIDAQSASVVDTQAFSLFPPDVPSSESAILSFAGRSDGTFAVGYGWAEDEPAGRAGIGRLGDSPLENSAILPISGDPSLLVLQTAAGWDGEAFAMHGYSAPPQFTLFVARVDEKANVLLPFTEFGLTQNPGYTVVAPRLSTNATSGRTFVFDADYQRIVNAHERDGKPVPFTEGGLLLEVPGTLENDSRFGAVSADSEGGAWFAWSDGWKVNNQLAIAHLDAEGVVTHSFQTKPPGDVPAAYMLQALVARAGGAWVVSATAERMYTFDVTDSGFSEPNLLIDGLDQYEQTDVRDLEAIEFQGEHWVSYSENKSPQLLRVLKAKPGCVYPGQPAVAESQSR